MAMITLTWLWDGATGTLVLVTLVIIVLSLLIWAMELFWKRYFATDFIYQPGEIFPQSYQTYDPLKPELAEKYNIYLHQNLEKFIAGEERWQPVVDPFAEFDELLKSPDSERYVMILAAPGMGKTAFVKGCKRWQQKKLHHRLKVAHLPLSRREARLRLVRLPNPRQTILILDNLESLFLPGVFPDKKLKRWMDKTRKFPLVMLIGRMEGLPPISSVPEKKGLCKIDSQPFHEYEFILYRIALPDTPDRKEWVNSTVPFYQFRKRRTYEEWLERNPKFVNKPLFLHYLPYIANETLVNHREGYRLICEHAATATAAQMKPQIEPHQLLDFWESLAEICYRQRMSGAGGAVSQEKFEDCCRNCHIDLHQWKPGNLSLVKKDQLGKWLFAEQSVEEYLVSRRFLALPETFDGLRFTKQLQTFLWDTFSDEITAGRELSGDWLRHGDFSAFRVRLPNQPSHELEMDDIRPKMITEVLERYPFFDRVHQPNARGLHHLFEPKVVNGSKVVVDHCTNLMWDQSDPFPKIPIREFENRLKIVRYAGFSDWRLPTLEEGLSLLYPQTGDSAYIHPALRDPRTEIWLAERDAPDSQWVAFFAEGTCRPVHVSDRHFVRLVRNC